MEEEAEFLRKEPCPNCNSKDNLARYDDGHGYCFGCGHYERGDDNMSTQETTTTKKARDLIEVGEPSDWGSRSITLASAQKWGFTRSSLNGTPVRIFNYRDSSQQIIAQKVRFANKDFKTFGNFKEAGLYGMHLWRDGGKKVVITEGEIDAISVSQAQGHKWPVVSVPNGAQGAKKALKNNLEWLNKFDEVILMFDMDKPGRAAVEECMSLFEPGQCKAAILPMKDANEMLMAGKTQELISCIWESKVQRPDGIVSGMDMLETVKKVDDSIRQSLPYQTLDEMMGGAGLGDVITLTAGSGIGKSAVTREIQHHLIQLGETVGMMMLEEDSRRTGLGLMSIAANKPLHLNREGVSDEEFQEAFDSTLGTGRVFLYDHFGSTAIDNLLAKIRYLAKGCDCRWIFIDHLSIIISGQDEGDERRLIDNTMTALKSLAMECNIGIFLVSHLKRPAGDKGHENGAETSLAQLRGSHSIAQLSDYVIGMERDQQNDKKIMHDGKPYALSNVTTLRILKNRHTGECGVAGWLLYDKATGRLYELLENPYNNMEEGDDGDDDSPF